MRYLLARLAAAVLVAAAVVAVPAPSAHAAACGDASGVTVVVDYASLGGGAGQACVAPGTARGQFESAGYPLTDVQSQPGLVCRVAGAPADVSCQDAPPAGAYWALWTSDGKSGRWSYASRGVDMLRVPAGGTVAFVWDDVAGSKTPSVAPPVHAASTATPSPSATTSPTPKPTTKPTSKPASKPTKPPSATPTQQPSATPTMRPSEQATPTPVEPTDAESTTPDASPSRSPSSNAASPGAPTSTPSATPSATDEPLLSPAAQPTEQDEGVPTWLVLAILGLLLLTAITLAVQRRRTARRTP